MVLKLTSSSSSEFVVRDVISNMWNQWRGKDGGRGVTGGGGGDYLEMVEEACPTNKTMD